MGLGCVYEFAEKRLKVAFWPKRGFVGRSNLDSISLQSPLLDSKIVLLSIFLNS